MDKKTMDMLGSNILDFAKDVVTTSLAISRDMADKVVDYASDLSGSKPHNVIHCGSKDSVIRCPNVPLCATLPGKSCQPGTLIAICATPSANFTKRFRVDFLTDCDHFTPQASSVALHFNPRFNENNVVIMNSLTDSSGWSEEERSDYFPFRAGVPFKMMILIDEEQFKIAVNGKHCYVFKHRMNYHNIKRLHIDGNLSVDLVEFRKELMYLDNVPKELASVSRDRKTCDELKAMFDEPENVKTVIVPSPTLPYNDQDTRFGKPFNIYIAGLMTNNFRRNFVVNFCKSQSDPQTGRMIPFHLSIRPQVCSIVRNSMVNDVWQQEEADFDGSFPFILGTHFDLMLCNRPDKVSVIVNGQLVCEFEHRIDHKIIDHVEINGSPLITSLRVEYF